MVRPGSNAVQYRLAPPTEEGFVTIEPGETTDRARLHHAFLEQLPGMPSPTAWVSTGHTWGGVERGEPNITSRTLEKIADFLEVDPRELLGDLPADEILIALKLGPRCDVVGQPHRLFMRSTVIESPRCQYPCDVVVQGNPLGL